MSLAKPARRNFLKILALGGGIFAVGNIMSHLENFNQHEPSPRGFSSNNNARIVENENEFILYDKNGEELIVVNKDA